jgi:hypothetical protein
MAVVVDLVLDPRLQDVLVADCAVLRRALDRDLTFSTEGPTRADLVLVQPAQLVAQPVPLLAPGVAVDGRFVLQREIVIVAAMLEHRSGAGHQPVDVEALFVAVEVAVEYAREAYAARERRRRSHASEGPDAVARRLLGENRRAVSQRQRQENRKASFHVPTLLFRAPGALLPAPARAPSRASES